MRNGHSTAPPNRAPGIPKSSHPKPNHQVSKRQRNRSAHNTPDTTASASLSGNSSDSRIARPGDGRDSSARRSATSTENTDASAVTDSNDAKPVFSILWIVLRLKPATLARWPWLQPRFSRSDLIRFESTRISILTPSIQCRESTLEEWSVPVYEFSTSAYDSA